MEDINKSDMKALDVKLQAYRAALEENDERMGHATVDSYTGLLCRKNEILIKIMAIEEAISRINNKNFSKNKPEYTTLPAAGSNLTHMLR